MGMGTGPVSATLPPIREYHFNVSLCTPLSLHFKLNLRKNFPGGACIPCPNSAMGVPAYGGQVCINSDNEHPHQQLVYT